MTGSLQPPASGDSWEIWGGPACCWSDTGNTRSSAWPHLGSDHWAEELGLGDHLKLESTKSLHCPLFDEKLNVGLIKILWSLISSSELQNWSYWIFGRRPSADTRQTQETSCWFLSSDQISTLSYHPGSGSGSGASGFYLIFACL